jgi:glycerol-3-phosphate acyltransferase PlsY
VNTGTYYSIVAPWLFGGAFLPGVIVAAVVGYLLGSIPFGLLLTRAIGIDIRNVGSGNIGATNVLRTGNKKLAAATLVLDALKGLVAVLIAHFVLLAPGTTHGGAVLYAAGIFAFLGHCFPVWLRFRGGKGVATLIGVLYGWAWPVGIIFCLVWLIIAATQKISSLSALTAAVTAPIFAYVAGLYLDWIDGPSLAAVTALLALLLIFNHRANIGRLIQGTEPRIGGEKKAA